jgi:periplasmic protein TonB
MFEDSLVESTGRIRTRSRRYAAGSFVLQATLLATVAAIPYLYPAALPQQALLTPLAAPPPPSEPAPISHVTVSRAAQAVQTISLTAPRIIPDHIAQNAASEPPADISDPLGYSGGDNVPGAAPSFGPAPKPPVVVRAKPTGPVRVSAGVAAGQLLAPIQPVYSAIARMTHVQGTVVIDAVISKDGTVEQARVVSGSPLLTEAALSAVSRARYRPYRLNGQPIAVETTIHIIFTLGE